jgi:hypothetical protein
MLIHNGNEVVAMFSLPEMDEFVDHDVFDAAQRLLREFEVKPDTACFDVAGTQNPRPLLKSPPKGALLACPKGRHNGDKSVEIACLEGFEPPTF